MTPNNELDSVIQALSEAPPSDRPQIEPAICVRLKDLVGKSYKEQADGLKTILDDCAYFSLASDFAMNAMDQVWKMAKAYADMQEKEQSKLS